MRRRPMCYGCGEKPARKGLRFCTQRCASEWAEELVIGNDDSWCPHCEDWVSIDTCDHGWTPEAEAAHVAHYEDQCSTPPQN